MSRMHTCIINDVRNGRIFCTKGCCQKFRATATTGWGSGWEEVPSGNGEWDIADMGNSCWLAAFV
jgi:hypothetical protein